MHGITMIAFSLCSIYDNQSYQAAKMNPGYSQRKQSRVEWYSMIHESSSVILNAAVCRQNDSRIRLKHYHFLSFYPLKRTHYMAYVVIIKFNVSCWCRLRQYIDKFSNIYTRIQSFSKVFLNQLLIPGRSLACVNARLQVCIITIYHSIFFV